MLARARRVYAAVAKNSTVVLYSGSTVAVQAIMLVCSIWALRYIAPEPFGVFQSGVVISAYLAVTQLGVLNGMNREYPFLLGQGNVERASALLSTAQSFAFANGALQALVFLALALLPGPGGSAWRLTCLTLAVCAPMRQYTSYLHGTFRSHHDFRKLAYLQFGQLGLYPALLLLPRQFGFVGFCAREVATLLVPMVAFHWLRPAKAKPFFERSAFRELFDTGWRLYLWSYLIDLGQLAPRTILGFFGGPLLLAMFAPANWMLLGLTGVAGSIAAYVYPTLTFRFGKGHTAMARAAIRAAVLTFLMLAPFVAIGVATLPFILSSLLPKYAASASAARLALLAGLFDCASIATVSFSVTRAWRPMALYLAAMLPVRGITAAVGYFALSDHVTGVALGTLVGSVLMVPITWFTVRLVDAPSVSAAVGQTS